MDREAAERLMDEMRKLDEVANSITDISMTLPDEQARSLRRIIADTLFKAHCDIAGPIVRAYPDLDLDREPSPTSNDSSGSSDSTRARGFGGAHG